MRDAPGRQPAPKHIAGVSVEAQHYKLVEGVRMRDAEDPLRLILRPRQAGINFIGVDCRKEEQLVLPDYRRGTAVSLDRDLPLDVVGWAPLDGRLGRGGDAVGIRSTPVMPVVWLGLLKLIRKPLAKRKCRGDQAKRCERGDFVRCHFLYFHFLLIQCVVRLLLIVRGALLCMLQLP